jgi:hypothetical protein
MKAEIIIFVDLNNTDSKGRVRLNTAGALNDIKTKNITLKDGLEVLLDDRQEFRVKGISEFSKQENIWVAKPDWSSCEEYERGSV